MPADHPAHDLDRLMERVGAGYFEEVHGVAWLDYVPAGKASSVNGVAGLKPHEVALEIGISAMEPPSAIALVRRHCPGIVIAMGKPGEPDPRLPLRPGAVLWHYDGTTETPALAPPDPDAAHAVGELAAQRSWGPPPVTYHAAARLRPVPVKELLSLLVHPPQSPLRARFSVWERTVQAWCCLGLLHHGEREQLCEIAFGVEDWTTAALYALVVSAWMDPDERRGVAGLVAARFEEALAAQRTRPVLIATSLAHLAYVTPGLPAATGAAAHRLIADEFADDAGLTRSHGPNRRCGNGSGGAEPGQGVAGDAVDGPLVLRHGAERLVEVDGGLVPVEHPPLHSPVAALQRDAGQLGQQRLAVASASGGGAHVEVLEVDPVRAAPGGEVEEPQGKTDRLAVLGAGQVGKCGGLRAENGLLQLQFGGDRLFRRLLVLGQLPDEVEDHRHIGGTGWSDHSGYCSPMRIVSVNLAAPKPNDVRIVGGFTGIDKMPTISRIPVRVPGPEGMGLDGDVSFLAAHGGGDQALYAYAREEYDWWEAELGRELRNGYFGDNLTTCGVDVNGTLIGERWRIGAKLVVQATYARIPCATFQAHMGEAQWVKRFTAHGYPGTYLRVLEPGEVGVGDDVTVIHRPGHDFTIAKMFRAWTVEQELLPSLLEVEDVPESLRAKARQRLGG
jgi:MOSC domain-containing protein YiiM